MLSFRGNAFSYIFTNSVRWAKFFHNKYKMVNGIFISNMRTKWLCLIYGICVEIVRMAETRALVWRLGRWINIQCNALTVSVLLTYNVLI